MKSNAIYKIMVAFILIPVLIIAGFIAMLIASLQGGDRFYVPLIMVSTIAVIIILIIGLINFMKPKVYWLLAGSLILAAGITIAGYEINKAYHNSFATMNDQGVDLTQYEPFKEDSKAVKMNEPAALTLTEHLPRLDGATALYPLYSAFAQAVYPSGEYKVYDSIVMSNNTVHAYESLIKGEADIIFAAQPSAEQRNEAKAAGLELKLTPIGREAFVFFVHKDNPVTGVTVSDIQDIYSGQVTNWKELGGKDSKIKAFQRPDNSGSQTMLNKLMEGHTLMTPPKQDVAAGMGGIIEQTADYRNYPNAIGYSFLYFATEMISNGEIRLLEVNKVKPERDTIASGEYPLAAEFYAVTAGSSNPNVEPFLQWITSGQGQLIVEKTGYTPLSIDK